MIWEKELKLANIAHGRSLLSIGNFHGARWCNSESLQSFFGSSWLHFILELHKSDVWTAWHQANLFEPRKSVTRKCKKQNTNNSKTTSFKPTQENVLWMLLWACNPWFKIDITFSSVSTNLHRTRLDKSKVTRFLVSHCMWTTNSLSFCFSGIFKQEEQACVNVDYHGQCLAMHRWGNVIPAH